MPKRSAGLVMYRKTDGGTEVLLVHPGGPFWAGRDWGAWSIPKGEYAPGDDSLEAARREFEEETGVVPAGDFVSLGDAKQPSGKVISAWAFEGNCDPLAVRSNTFSMEWPRGSGRTQEFPEIDRAQWFGIDEAKRRVVAGQVPLLEALERTTEGK